MKFAHLADRSLIEISGEDAEGFLDNIITCNILNLDEEQASFGALLTPQGKILFDFFVIKTPAGFLIDIAEQLTTDFIKRLTFYRLRAKVDIKKIEDMQVYALWDSEIVTNDLTIQDPRLPSMGYRLYANQAPTSDASDYETHRITNGIPEGAKDFDYGDAYPHEVLMDQNGGVDFKKGCYVGQEVVSRMQHRGTAKKRIINVFSDAPLPTQGTAITADGKPAGQLGSTVNTTGLALLRLDRIAKAENLMAGEINIKPAVQNWVTFEIPKAE